MPDNTEQADQTWAAERIERLLDPAEFDVPPLHDADPHIQALYLDPTSDLADPIARHAVSDRRLAAVRAILHSYRTDIVTLIRTAQAQGPGAPPVHGSITRALNLLREAEIEVLVAERGCGQPDGECTDPCHAGVRDHAVGDVASDPETTPHS